MSPSKASLIWIKRSIFLLGLIPVIRLVWFGFSDQLGANPVELIEHSTGTWALVALWLSLAITPLRHILGWGWLISLRRMLGLFMFFYASLHFIVYLWLDHWFDWHGITEDIAKHPYVLVGFLAFLMSMPLAITSSDALIRRLGKHWKKLHALAYLIAILAVLHYLWLVKKDISQPVIYSVILFGLFSIRIYYKLRSKLSSF